MHILQLSHSNSTCLPGNADALGTELLESLLKMAPTKEEEQKLKECEDDSPVKFGSAAERFLKAVLHIPFAFKRVDAMLYITNIESDVEYLKKCFQTLEVYIYIWLILSLICLLFLCAYTNLHKLVLKSMDCLVPCHICDKSSWLYIHRQPVKN